MAFMRKVRELRENPMSTGIYGAEEDLSDLLESIPRCGGIISPLLVKPDGTIISGHRRFRAAKQLGLESVPCEGCDPKTPEEEMILIIEANKSRVKTASQIYDEGQKLTAALAELARKRSAHYVKISSLNRDDAEQSGSAESALSLRGAQKHGKTSVIVADSLGLSERNWQKIQFIGRYAEMRNSTAMDAMAKLNAGKITINRAHDLVRASLRLTEEAESSREPEVPKTPEEILIEDILQADQLMDGLIVILKRFGEISVDAKQNEHPTDMYAWRSFRRRLKALIELAKSVDGAKEKRADMIRSAFNTRLAEQDNAAPPES